MKLTGATIRLKVTILLSHDNSTNTNEQHQQEYQDITGFSVLVMSVHQNDTYVRATNKP
jgi:hypothetical protein